MFVRPALIDAKRHHTLFGALPEAHCDKVRLVVRDPATKRPLPAHGAEVSDAVYWHRRLRDGDIEIVDPEKAAREAKDAPGPLGFLPMPPAQEAAGRAAEEAPTATDPDPAA